MKTKTNNILNSKWKLAIGAFIVCLAILSSFVMFNYSFAGQKDYNISDPSLTRVGGSTCNGNRLTQHYSCGKDNYVTDVYLSIDNQGKSVDVCYVSHAGSDFWRLFDAVSATFKVNAVNKEGKLVARFSVKTWNYVNGFQYERITGEHFQKAYGGMSESAAKKLTEDADNYYWYIDKIIVWD